MGWEKNHGRDKLVFSDKGGKKAMDRYDKVVEKVASSLASAGADEEYRTKMVKVRSLVKELGAKLDKHESYQKRQSNNWGFVGDLGHLESELQGMVNNLNP